LHADEAGAGAARGQALGDLLLLLHREQDVGAGADGQRLVHLHLRQRRAHIALGVLGPVEPAHRAAEGEAAGGVVAAQGAAGGAPMASALSTCTCASAARTSPSAYSARSNQSIERLR